VDLFGREVKGYGEISSFPCQIDISDLSNGLYFLQIIGNDGISGSVKFLKISE
jgi:hypothetical protein